MVGALLDDPRKMYNMYHTSVFAAVCPGNSSSLQYPLTCGGGSGIVQSTALLMLQSENAALKREIAQYKKKLHQLSRYDCHGSALFIYSRHIW